MMRSILLAVGIFLLILGVESLIVDKVVLANSNKGPVSSSANRLTNRGQFSNGNPYQNVGYSRQSSYYSPVSQIQNRPKKVIQTKEWMPWSLLAAGAIVVLYSYSLPQNGGSIEG